MNSTDFFKEYLREVLFFSLRLLFLIASCVVHTPEQKDKFVIIAKDFQNLEMSHRNEE